MQKLGLSDASHLHTSTHQTIKQSQVMIWLQPMLSIDNLTDTGLPYVEALTQLMSHVQSKFYATNDYL